MESSKDPHLLSLPRNIATLPSIPSKKSEIARRSREIAAYLESPIATAVPRPKKVKKLGEMRSATQARAA